MFVVAFVELFVVGWRASGLADDKAVWGHLKKGKFMYVKGGLKEFDKL